MQINRLELANWLAHHHRVIDFAPMTIVAGPNASGKSSIADAIAFVLGETRRITAKADRAKLITNGADKGTVTLTCGTVTLAKDIGTGKMKAGGARLPLSEQTVPEALPYVLDSARFANAEPDERRRLLRLLMDADNSPPAILALLAKRGHAKVYLDCLKPTQTIDEWAAYADRQAVESRGAWKAIAGEPYGSEKARDFVITAPDGVPAETLAALEAELRTIQADVTALHREQGALDQADATAGRQADVTALLRRQADMLFDAQAMANAAEAELTRLIDERPALLARQQDAQQRVAEAHLTCPECGSLLSHEPPRTLRPYAPPAEPASEADLRAIAAELATLDSTIRAQSTKASSTRQQLAACTTAAEAVAQMGPPPDDAPASNRRADLDRELADATARLQVASVNTMRAREGHAALERATTATTRARGYHDAVTAWVAIKAALSPAGIPGELLQKALGPFNIHLAELASGSKWPPVTLGPDMDVYLQGRPYALLSRSEQWRADTMLTIAVSAFSDLGFILLDAFDTLDPPSRSPALAWLYGLIRAGQLDSVIIMATLKAPPPVPAAVAVHWLGEPILEEAKAA